MRAVGNIREEAESALDTRGLRSHVSFSFFYETKYSFFLILHDNYPFVNVKIMFLIRYLIFDVLYYMQSHQKLPRGSKSTCKCEYRCGMYVRFKILSFIRVFFFFFFFCFTFSFILFMPKRCMTIYKQGRFRSACTKVCNS